MEEDIFKKYFEVRKIRGRDESNIFRNYNADLPRLNVEMFFKSVFQNHNMQKKDDSMSKDMREAGNLIYFIKDFDEARKLYNKSIRYSQYDSEHYATALANRSAAFYSTNDYEDCVKDINLCLKANCPNRLKPKIYFRKVRCLNNLGRISEMKTVLQDLLDFLDKSPMLDKEMKETHQKLIEEFMKIEMKDSKRPDCLVTKMPQMDPNPTFLNASKSIDLRYNKQTGRYVIAKQQIPQGQVLFVEKAYAFASSFMNESKKISGQNYCQYCLTQTKSFVPCKTCVLFVFCNEDCRDRAWKEFHQWECFAVRCGLFFHVGLGVLAFRIIMKAAHTDFYVNSSDNALGITKYDDKNNIYTYVHTLCTHFENMNKETAMKFAASSVIMVNYLYQKTNFFTWLKQRPAFSKTSDKDLQHRVGSLLLRHLAQLSSNTLEVQGFNEYDLSRTGVAKAVLPSISTMSHSCVPNVSFYFIGDTAVVKANRKINANEKICYSYMDLRHCNLPKFARQMLLAEMCGFKCRCQACTNPESEIVDAYLCLKCKCPAPLVSMESLIKSTCICLTCKFKFTVPDTVHISEKIVEQYLLKFKEHHNLEDAKRCLNITKEIVNPHHNLCGSIYYALLEYYIHQKADLKNFMKYVKILLDSGHKRYGDIAFENGIFIFKMCTKLSKALNGYSLKGLGPILKEAKEILQEAKLIFDLYHPTFNHRIIAMEECFTEKEKAVRLNEENGGGDHPDCICGSYDDIYDEDFDHSNEHDEDDVVNF